MTAPRAGVVLYGKRGNPLRHMLALDGHTYNFVSKADAMRIIERHLCTGNPSHDGRFVSVDGHNCFALHQAEKRLDAIFKRA